ncbi:ABC transporter ATP-binding protein/permease [Kitasatospora sp. NBC_00085]|uniref:ABC transporter ATP-binding protein n=1 Tax=unclassified Kitasatospora TaxID=2633591 RepID=UPI003249DAFC
MITAVAGRARTAAAALRLGWRASPGGILLQLLLALLTGVLPAVTAYVTKLLVDALAGAGGPGAADGTRVAWLAAAGAVLAGAIAVFNHVTALTGAVVGRAVNLEVQDRLYERVNAYRGLRPFEDPATQDRIRLAETAAQGAPHDVLDFLLDSVRSSATIAGFLGTVLVFWPPMGALLVVCVAVSVVGHVRTSRGLADTAAAIVPATRRYYFYRTLLIDPRAAKEIRLFGTGPLFRRRALDGLRETTGAGLAALRRSVLVQSGLALLTAAAAGTAAVVVARQVLVGRITLGDMTLFTAAVAAVQGALSSIVMQLGRAEEALRLFGHYLALLGSPVDLTEGTVVPAPLRDGITFEDVWFRYTPDGPWALRGVGLHLPHGRAVGLAGVNGAGKSTLVKLLCRFYDPERGRILWDGVDIRTMPVDELRRRIGATFQDFMTYDLTAAENIGLGAPEHREDLGRIRAAAGRAGIDGTLERLPRGYRTLLSRTFTDEDEQDGVTLSGGQWQRVALARSLMREDGELLILDEPSSGLDALAERQVHQALRRHRAGRTSLLISHRLAALREADMIVVLSEGRVVERGSHDELVALDGRYAEMFAAQAEGYRADGPPAPAAGRRPPARTAAGQDDVQDDVPRVDADRPEAVR